MEHSGSPAQRVIEVLIIVIYSQIFSPGEAIGKAAFEIRR